MGGLVTELKMDPIDALDAQPAFLESLKEKGMLTHLKWVFRVLEYIVKFSRVRTGRSRAAWFPLMDSYGHDYQRSLGGARVEGGAVAEGYGMGTYDDQPFYTTVMNNVSYVEFMNST